MNQETSRRGFLLLGAAVLVSGCTEGFNIKPSPNIKPRIKKRVKKKGNTRNYPCGFPLRGDSETWEYTVITTARYFVKVNGRYVKRPKVFILCGKKAASKWKSQHRKDSVTRTAP